LFVLYFLKFLRVSFSSFLFVGFRFVFFFSLKEIKWGYHVTHNKGKENKDGKKRENNKRKKRRMIQHTDKNKIKGAATQY
jgi:hypothetical protein